MIKILLIFFFIFFGLLVTSCSKKETIETTKKDNKNPSIVYTIAMSDLELNKYDEAKLKFEEIIYEFPLSNEGIQSQIMLAFIDYLQLDYLESIYKFNKIIKLYPSHKNIDYVLYMRALCYYEQIENENLDGSKNHQALNNFNELINKYPDSKYAKDSKQKIILIKENIAAKHMIVALYYLKNKKYLAALNRFNTIIKEHSESKFTPEALHRLVEVYYSMGMLEEAKKTASVLAFNYPKSKWYKYSYNLLEENRNIKNNFSISKTITNFFIKDETN